MCPLKAPTHQADIGRIALLGENGFLVNLVCPEPSAVTRLIWPFTIGRLSTTSYRAKKALWLAVQLANEKRNGSEGRKQMIEEGTHTEMAIHFHLIGVLIIVAIWNEAIEDLFIILIQERPALYDITEAKYSNRIVKTGLWREIESQLGFSGKIIFFHQLSSWAETVGFLFFASVREM